MVMKSNWLLPALAGLLAVEGVLLAVAVAAGLRLPSFVTFFLVCMPLVLLFVLGPSYFWRGTLLGSPGSARCAGWMAAPLFVAGVLMEMGTRQEAILVHGPVVRELRVRDAAEHADAVAFEFVDGRGRPEFSASAVDRHGRTSDLWHVVPYVADDWTKEEAIGVWALALDEIPPELAEGKFRAGRRETEAGPMSAAREAIATAGQTHGLRAEASAIILRMDTSLAEIHSANLSLCIVAAVAANLAWIGLVIAGWRLGW